MAAVLRRRPTTEPAAGCAVLRGAGLNQDGRSASLTAPRAASQTALIQAVMRQAGVSPSEVFAVLRCVVLCCGALRCVVLCFV